MAMATTGSKRRSDIMGDDKIGILEAKAAVEGEKLGIVDRIVGRIISRKY